MTDRLPFTYHFLCLWQFSYLSIFLLFICHLPIVYSLVYLFTYLSFVHFLMQLFISIIYIFLFICIQLSFANFHILFFIHLRLCLLTYVLPHTSFHLHVFFSYIFIRLFIHMFAYVFLCAFVLEPLFYASFNFYVSPFPVCYQEACTRNIMQDIQSLSSLPNEYKMLAPFSLQEEALVLFLPLFLFYYLFTLFLYY